MPDEEPKIIIDEDWKSQVQREKEQVEESDEAAPAADTGESEPEADGKPPEADFLSLVNTLAAQTMFSLGLIGPPDAKEVSVDIEGAKFLIDTILMLRDKTKGNLTEEEEGAMSEAVSELQRAYVIRAQQVQEAALHEAGIDMNNLRGPKADS